ncbi:esterase/lipase family protein [Candidatus Oscillochloris fontis]|uniref:esterase/lipase family protein n=1 Tax=Candidatus Oscillochloris fontis TaxID=2496868 RepID=UPI00101C2D63|nr:lipase [Candidatus Oscillochloris fontis]
MNRPVVIVGGWLSSPADYTAMARVLAAPPYNRIVYITDISRREWAALRDPHFSPVLDLVANTVQLALRETGADRIDLIGHSAGGRVSRAYLGHLPFAGVTYDGQRYVASLTTLGTAHETYEIWVKEFAGQVNEFYPGAFYEHIQYRSVAGESVKGRKYGNLEEMLAYQSYETAFGSGKQIGDGIIPTVSCYLAGADNLVLKGARHAPYNAPSNWYGARNVIPLWFD